MKNGKAPDLDASVLIATRNREALLRPTLEGLARLDAAGIAWEVIVVDNGSTDGTAAVLASAGARLPLTALYEPRPGKNRALNRALPLARGGLLVFTDDDVEPGPRWLAEHLAASRRWPAHAIFGGPVSPKYPPGTPAWLPEHAFAGGAFARFERSGGEGPSSALPLGPNYAVRAASLSGRRFCEEIGSQGKESDLLGGETELLQRLRDEGAGVVYVPSAGIGHVVEPHQVALPWLLRRSFRLGRTMARLKPRLDSKRLFGAPIGLLTRLPHAHLRYAWARLRGERARFEAGAKLYRLRGRIYEDLARVASPQRIEWLLPPGSR